MFLIDPRSREPIYEQIKHQVLALVSLGALEAHDQLPSIRELAKQLDINVNTVKRAFMDLEAHGVIYSLPGRGNFVAEDALAGTRLRQEALESLAHGVKTAQAAGMGEDEILEHTNKLLKDKGDLTND